MQELFTRKFYATDISSSWEAAPPVNGNDIKRPLTARGHAQAEQTATFLKDIVKPDIFVVSPLLRAQETLAHIRPILKMCQCCYATKLSLTMMQKKRLNGYLKFLMSRLWLFAI